MQPAADVVAGRPAAPDHFVMTAAAAEIARPAGPAGLLPVNMPRGQPVGLTGTIDAVVERTHRAFLVADEAMAGRQLAVGGDAEIAGAGAARIGAVGAAMNLAHGVDHVGEGIALGRLREARSNSRPQSIISPSMSSRSPACISPAAGGRAQHRREADAVKAGAR